MRRAGFTQSHAFITEAARQRRIDMKKYQKPQVVGSGSVHPC
jgi:hypothetical protein